MDNNYMKTILSGIKEWTRSLIQKTANNVQRAVETAQKTADTAQRTADNAQVTANNAQVTANNAQVTADNAQVTADNAQVTADNAQVTADNALHPQILYDDQILIWDGTTTATESTVQVKYFTYVSASDSTKKTRYYRIFNISDNVVKYALAHYEDIKCATKVQNGTENEMELIDNWYVDSSGLCVSCEDYYIIIVGESGSHVARFPGVTVPFRIDFPQAGIYIGYCTDSSVEGDAGKSFTHKIALPTYGLPLDSVILTTDSDKNIQIVDTETGTKKTLKSAYAYAQDGGYLGTEEEFAAKLAAEKLPNPYPLTFTGAVSETYDGSSAKTIEIPRGGGASGMNLSLVYENTFESVASINETIDALSGKENFVFNIEFTIPSDSTTAATITNADLYNGEFDFPIAYYVGYGNYSTAYPKKAAYGSFLKLGEGFWERIRLKAVSVEMFCNQNNLVGKDGIAFQYLKDNQNNHAAGLRIDFNQTMESVKIQIYAG